MQKKFKILIGGGNGYIGTKLSDYLKKKKYNFEVIDLNLYKNCKLYNSNYKHKIKNLDVRDITDDYLKKFDVYIHLAAITNNPVDNFKDKNKLYKITRDYTKGIAKKCKKNNIKFIFASSCSVYGQSKNRNLNEKSKCYPISHYARNKLEIEKDLRKLSNKNFKPIVLRISTLYGFSPRMRFDLALSIFIAMSKIYKEIRLNSDGRAWRPHLYLNDLVRVFEKCIHLNNKKFEIINVGSNKNNFRMIDVAKIVSELTNSKIVFLNKKNTNDLIKDKTVNYGKDKRNYSVNFDKINKIFKNFKFTSVRSGLRKDIKFLKKIKMSRNILKDKKYFRLHYLSHLLKTKKIDANLRKIK